MKLFERLSKELWQAFRKHHSPTDGEALTDLLQLPSIWEVQGQVDWLVEGLIGKNSVTLISSESGTGKTWLAYYLAGCVAHGRQVAGKATKQSKVLYVDGENPAAIAKRNLAEMGIQQTADLIVWGGWCPEPPRGPEDRLIERFAREHKGLIIYDSLVEFHSGDEQSSTQTREFMKHFRALSNLGSTVIVLHHTGKAKTAKEYRGSSDIKAAVDTAYLLEEVSKDAGRLGRLALTNFKCRLAPGVNIGLDYRKGVGFVACDAPAPADNPLDVLLEIVRHHPGLNQGDVVELARGRGLSKGEAEDILRENRQNKFRVVQGQGAAKLYYLADAPPPVAEAAAPAEPAPAPAEEVLA